MNDNKNLTYQTSGIQLEQSSEEVIAVNAYIKEENRSQIYNLIFYLKILEKQQKIKLKPKKAEENCITTTKKIVNTCEHMHARLRGGSPQGSVTCICWHWIQL